MDWHKGGETHQGELTQGDVKLAFKVVLGTKLNCGGI
jgi:hypothetical protein